MKKSIKVLISIIILLLGFIIADCVFGFVFGGPFNLKAGIITFLFGVFFTFISILIIYDKNERKQAKTKKTFCIIIIIFMLFCLFGYKPLNHISGTDEYIEKTVEVVNIYGRGKGDFAFLEPEFDVTVKDKNGKEFVVGDYNVIINYSEGDIIILKEFTGGFGLKYYYIVSDNIEWIYLTNYVNSVIMGKTR